MREEEEEEGEEEGDGDGRREEDEEEPGNDLITQFCDDPVMYLVGHSRGFGVVKVTKMKCTCILCHSEKCIHVKLVLLFHNKSQMFYYSKLNGKKKEDLNDHRIMMEAEEEEAAIVPRYSPVSVSSCPHGIRLQSMKRGGVDESAKI